MKNPNSKRLQKSQKKALVLLKVIEQACITAGLNLTIHDGKIGFVDQDLGRIVALWEPKYCAKPDATQGGDSNVVS